MNESRRFAVAQLGARMHYAVPRILFEAHVLVRLYTDISIDHGVTSLIGRLPGSDKLDVIRRLRGRHIEGVSSKLVTAFDFLGFRYAYKLRRAINERARLAAYLWVADEFSRLVNKFGMRDANSVYGFNGASLGIFSQGSSDKIFKVLEQTIAPKKIEVRIMGEAARSAGEYEENFSPELTEFIRREEEEWALANIILCASDFVAQGLISCGVPATKCIVVPYGVDLISYHQQNAYGVDHKSGNCPVRVLFVGGVGTRKGIWTLLAAMKGLLGIPVECRVIGPISADRLALERACPGNVKFIGSIPRSDIPKELHNADIFCLPSLCEGSATVIYEALAAGLPVVTTANSGSIVRHGVEGLIVDAGDQDQLAQALLQLATDHEMRHAMSQRAVERSEFGSFSAYSHRLIAAVNKTPAANDGVACV